MNNNTKPNNIVPAYIYIILSMLIIYAFKNTMAASDPVSECHQLAAHPDDPEKVGQGVYMSSMDSNRAIAACKAALRISPNDGRLAYQYARALESIKKFKAALKWYDKSTHPWKLFSISAWFSDGYGGLQKNPQKALSIYKMLYEKFPGNVVLESNIGVVYEDMKNYKEAEKWYLKAAKKGHANAMLDLADLHGWVFDDVQRQFYWIRQAAKLGHPSALKSLAKANKKSQPYCRTERVAIGYRSSGADVYELREVCN